MPHGLAQLPPLRRGRSFGAARLRQERLRRERLQQESSPKASKRQTSHPAPLRSPLLPCPGAQALEGEVAELRAAAAEGEESLGDCLTSLGQEEAKVGGQPIFLLSPYFFELLLGPC